MKTNPKIVIYLDRAVNFLLVLFCLTATVSVSLSEIGYFGSFFVWLIKLIYTGEHNFKRTQADLPLLIFTILTIIAVFTGLDSISELGNRLKPLSLMLIFPLIVNNLNDKKTAYNLFLCLFFSMLLQSLIIIFKGISTKDLSLGIGIGGTMSVTLTAGELIVTLLGAALCFVFIEKEKKVRIFVLIALVLGIVAMIFTLARSAWVAFIAVLLIFTLFWNKKILFGIIPVLIIIIFGSYIYKDSVFVGRINSVFKISSGTTPQRFAMWRSGLKMARDYPLGVGIDNVIKKYKDYSEPSEKHRERGHLHNNYLQIAVERGVLTLLAFLWLFYVVIKTAYVNYLRNTNNRIKVLFLSVILALVSFLVTGVFEYGLGSAIYAPLIWFFAALAVVMPQIPNGKEF